NSLI
ncbi:hypothetical protein D047_2074B, partial [Vibrio parahaemolyticus VPTS-2010_2]